VVEVIEQIMDFDHRLPIAVEIPAESQIRFRDPFDNQFAVPVRIVTTELVNSITTPKMDDLTGDRLIEGVIVEGSEGLNILGQGAIMRDQGQIELILLHQSAG